MKIRAFITMIPLLSFSLSQCGFVVATDPNNVNPNQGQTGNQPFVETPTADGLDEENCTWNGIPLYGEVEVVENFADIEVEIVESFPDLQVEIVENFPDDCGEWEMVENFADFTIEFVDSFPDLEIEYVTSFPGIP